MKKDNAISRLDAYERYIQSPEWKARREEAIVRDGGRCRICNSPDDLEVHHREYAPNLKKNDRVENLTTLCKSCHETATSLIRGRRYKARKFPRPTTKQKEFAKCKSASKSKAPAPSFSTAGRSSIPKTNSPSASKRSAASAPKPSPTTRKWRG